MSITSMRNMYKEVSKETIEKDLTNLLNDIKETEGFQPQHEIILETQAYFTIYRVAQERKLFSEEESQKHRDNYFEAVNNLMEGFWY